MTNYAVLRKIGTPHIYDRTTGMEITLPEPFQIIHYHQKSWNGGSADGNQYLHIDRIKTGDGEVPTILAEGDLDLFLVSTGRPEQINAKTRGVEVAGTIGGKDVRGYIALTAYDQNFSYLVFVASLENRYTYKQKTSALAIAALATRPEMKF